MRHHFEVFRLQEIAYRSD